jgi:polysaccharide biosynthesis protein PslG
VKRKYAFQWLVTILILASSGSVAIASDPHQNSSPTNRRPPVRIQPRRAATDHRDPDHHEDKRKPRRKPRPHLPGPVTTTTDTVTTTTDTVTTTTVTVPTVPTTDVMTAGVQFHCPWSSWTDSDRAAVLDKMWAAGLRWVRIDIGWSSLEKAPGVFDKYGIGLSDKCVSMSTSRGFHVLVTLWRTPPWANGNRSVYTPPTNPNDYGDIAQTLAARYDGTHGVGKVDAWEVWNEPNQSQYYTGTAAQYVALVQASYARFHAGDPSALVVAGGPAGNSTGYINELYANGLTGASFDVISVHPYQARSNNPPEVADPSPGVYGTPGDWYMSHTPTLHQLMAAHGDGAKPIWWTEFGWSTCVNAGTNNWQLCVSEATQADYLVRALKLAKASYPWVTNAFIYDARDDAANLASHSDNLAILHNDLTPKPALSALAAYCRPAC